MRVIPAKSVGAYAVNVPTKSAWPGPTLGRPRDLEPRLPHSGDASTTSAGKQPVHLEVLNVIPQVVGLVQMGLMKQLVHIRG